MVSLGKVVSMLASSLSCSRWPTFFMCFPCSPVFQQCCCTPPPSNRLMFEEVTRHSNKLGELSKHTHVILLFHFTLGCPNGSLSTCPPTDPRITSVWRNSKLGRWPRTKTENLQIILLLLLWTLTQNTLAGRLDLEIWWKFQSPSKY